MTNIKLSIKEIKEGIPKLEILIKQKIQEIVNEFDKEKSAKLTLELQDLRTMKKMFKNVLEKHIEIEMHKNYLEIVELYNLIVNLPKNKKEE